MRLLTCLAIVAATMVACGDDGSAGGCGRPVREDLDPLSTVHQLRPDQVEYLTSPPTSGPHLSIAGPEGLLDDPLDELVQVTVLGRGGVVVQYRPEIDPQALTPLLEAGDVVIAPSPDLDDSIVATAWTIKVRCGTVDLDALESFAAENVGAEHH